MTQIVFVDTEFTNFDKPDLISIGCAASNNEYWYSENSEFNRNGSTEWVKENIYPLLQGGNYEMPRQEIAETLWEWFDKFEKPVIVMVDYRRDSQLLLELFDYGQHPKIKSICNVYQSFAQLHTAERFSILEDRMEKLIEEFFQRNSTLSQHIALYDAMALKFAFETVVKEFNLIERDYV